MSTTTNPTKAAMTAKQLAQAEEDLKRNLREVAEQRVATERREAEAARKEAERLTALGEAQANLQRELDGAFAAVTKALPGFDQLPAKIEAAMARYTEAAGRLGDRWPEQQHIRHPAHRLLSWLKLFAAPERQG